MSTRSGSHRSASSSDPAPREDASPRDTVEEGGTSSASGNATITETIPPAAAPGDPGVHHEETRGTPS